MRPLHCLLFAVWFVVPLLARAHGDLHDQIATVGANVTVFASTGLQANKQYYYRVRSSNSFGNSAYSNTASARTLRK